MASMMFRISLSVRRERDGLGLCLGQGSDGVAEPVRGEDRGEPAVEGGQDVAFADVDVERVFDVVGQGVLPRVTAPVVGLLVAALGLHPAPAQAAQEQAAQDVRMPDALVDLLHRPAGSPMVRSDGLDGLELLGPDQGFVNVGVGPDPGPGIVPSHPGLIAESNLIDVKEDFVLALLVQDLPAGVARVGQDALDGRLGRALTGAVAVAMRVVLRRRRDSVTQEPFSDREQPSAGEVFGEDPLHDRRCDGIGFEPVQSLAVGCLGRVRVRSGVGDPVPVGRAAAEEPHLDLRLGRHRRPYTDLDAAPFALGHPAEHAHDQVVGL